MKGIINIHIFCACHFSSYLCVSCVFSYIFCLPVVLHNWLLYSWLWTFIGLPLTCITFHMIAVSLPYPFVNYPTTVTASHVSFTNGSYIQLTILSRSDWWFVLIRNGYRKECQWLLKVISVQWRTIFVLYLTFLTIHHIIFIIACWF